MNESGCTTGDTLFAAYKELNTTITAKREEKGKEDDTHVIVADGHKTANVFYIVLRNSLRM